MINTFSREITTVSDDSLNLNPAFVQDAAESRLINTLTLVVGGNLPNILVEQYDGYFRFRTAWSANKHTFGKTYNHKDGRVTFQGNGGYKGFLSAMHSRLTAARNGSKGFYARGAIFPMGLDSIRDIIDGSPANPVGKVMWSWVSDETRELLRKAGVVQKVDGEDADRASYWQTYWVNRGRVIRGFTVMADTWELFTASLAAKGLTPKDAEAKQELDDYNTAWNRQNRYDGFEFVQRVLEGKLMVGVKPAEMYDFEYTVDSFNMLFAPEAERQNWLDGNAAAWKGNRQLGKVAYAMAQDDFKVPAATKEIANDTNVVIWNGKEAVVVTRLSLIGKRIKFVHKDNTPAGSAISIVIKKDSDIDGALVMAVNRKGLIALA